MRSQGKNFIDSDFEYILRNICARKAEPSFDLTDNGALSIEQYGTVAKGIVLEELSKMSRQTKTGPHGNFPHSPELSL